MMNKVKFLLIDTKRPIPSSAHVPVRGCSGTTPSTMSCSSSCSNISDVEPEQTKKANVTVETDNALPNASVETMAQVFVKIDNERIPDSIESDGKSSSSKQQQSCKYNAEPCLSMVLLDPIESSKGSKDAVKYQDRASIVASGSTYVRFGRVSLSFSNRDEIAGGV